MAGPVRPAHTPGLGKARTGGAQALLAGGEPEGEPAGRGAKVGSGLGGGRLGSVYCAFGSCRHVNNTEAGRRTCAKKRHRTEHYAEHFDPRHNRSRSLAPLPVGSSPAPRSCLWKQQGPRSCREGSSELRRSGRLCADEARGEVPRPPSLPNAAEQQATLRLPWQLHHTGFASHCCLLPRIGVAGAAAAIDGIDQTAWDAKHR